ncbi:MAG: hypothetical protein K6D02_00235 [Lachnospiraceae bacterium]|nr:hypothetical protein [Lachnospiraceae bacterium]
MTRYEFLNELRQALSGNISDSEIEDNIRYYEDYFNNSGKSDEEVINELGDPRLIARSIIDSGEGDGGRPHTFYTSSEESYSNSSSESEESGKKKSASGMELFLKMFLDREEMTLWEKIKFWTIVILAMAVVVAVAILIVKAMVQIVIPILIIVFIIGLVVSLFSGRD